MKQIDKLVELGQRLKTSAYLKELIERSPGNNPWFTADFVRYAINDIADNMLNREKLQTWLGRYQLHPVNKTIGLIFAGNVPLVGFHDFLCCYVAGTNMKIKLSSKDDLLFPFILKELEQIDSDFIGKAELVEKLKDFDAVIATGSNNTHRYFEYYFREYPKILRKNRNAVAVLCGNETPEQLNALADDVFLYFGFGCRNVSKLYVPVGYDFSGLFSHFDQYRWLFQHTKYMNNYDYNRTLLLLNKTPHLANEFLMLQEQASIPSPIGMLYYQHWHDAALLTSQLKQNADQIQCIVAGSDVNLNGLTTVAFGQAQHPQLWDYADGVDTLGFLLGL